MKKMKKDEKTPLFLFILIVLLVLVTFALITISENLKNQHSESSMDKAIEQVETVTDEYL